MTARENEKWVKAPMRRVHLDKCAVALLEEGEDGALVRNYPWGVKLMRGEIGARVEYYRGSRRIKRVLERLINGYPGLPEKQVRDFFYAEPVVLKGKAKREFDKGFDRAARTKIVQNIWSETGENIDVPLDW